MSNTREHRNLCLNSNKFYEKRKYFLKSKTIDKMVGKYQNDGNDAYCFGRDSQFALFQLPFQAKHWSQAEVLFADIDHTGCHHFPYLLNVVCLNRIIGILLVEGD